MMMMKWGREREEIKTRRNVAWAGCHKDPSENLLTHLIRKKPFNSHPFFIVVVVESSENIIKNSKAQLFNHIYTQQKREVKNSQSNYNQEGNTTSDVRN